MPTAEADAAPALDSPFHIAEATLAAADPPALTAFYERLGLERLDAVTLGAGGAPLLRIVRADRPAAPAAAGLFHLAWLLPSRAALGRWLAHARAENLRFEGASDHGVSEAFYLSDPEGNGIEVYADRAPAEWPRDAQGYAMTTARMDVGAVAAAGGGAAARLPSGTLLGHVHLRAADLAAAERLYVDGFGMTVTHRRPGAAWFGAGSYHHHLAANAWAGPLAPRAPGAPGLVSVALTARDADTRARLASALAAASGRDPTGVALTLA